MDIINDLYAIGEYPLYRFELPVIKSNMYILPIGQTCLVVDPCKSREAEQVFRSLGIKECLVLLTHEHYDHISGVNWLRDLAKCKVVCSKICGERICDPKKNHAAFFEALFLGRDEQTQKEASEFTDPNYSCQADAAYAGSFEFGWHDMKIELVEAPGHSPGSQIIRLKEKYYFTGDYLIPGEEVITRLPGGSKRTYETVTRPYLEKIDSGSFIFPGHGQPGFLFEQRM